MTKEKWIMHVPQGCYGEVNPRANELEVHEVVGLYTTGIGPCCHVIVRNKETNHTILCHADSITDLKDQNHGVPAWINKVCPQRDWNNLEVHIGEGEGRDNWRLSNKNGEMIPHYINQVKDGIRMATGINRDLSSVLKAQYGPVENCEFRDYGIAVKTKTSGEDKIIEIGHDIIKAKRDIQIEFGSTVLLVKEFPIQTRFRKNYEGMLPPIHTSQGDKIFTMEEIQAKYPSINFTPSPELAPQQSSSQVSTPRSNELDEKKEHEVATSPSSSNANTLNNTISSPVALQPSIPIPTFNQVTNNQEEIPLHSSLIETNRLLATSRMASPHTASSSMQVLIQAMQSTIIRGTGGVTQNVSSTTNVRPTNTPNQNLSERTSRDISGPSK